MSLSPKIPIIIGLLLTCLITQLFLSSCWRYWYIFAGLNINNQINISTTFPFSFFYIYCIQNLTHTSLVSERRAEKSPPFSFYMNIFDTLNISFLLQVPILGRNCSDLVMFDIVIWQSHTSAWIWVWLSNFKNSFLSNAFALLVTGALLCHPK